MPPKANGFTCSIEPFLGEARLLDFFFDQLVDLQEVNAWTDQQSLIFFRGRLRDEALDFFLSSPEAKTAPNLEQMRIIFKAFFRPPNPQFSRVELNNIKLLPGESCLNLGHRIHKLVAIVHPTTTDREALQSMKLSHLMGAIPVEYKYKLLERHITDFQTALDLCQTLLDIDTQKGIVQPSTSSQNVNNCLSAEVNTLRQEFNSFKESNNVTAMSTGMNETNRGNIRYENNHDNKRANNSKGNKYNKFSHNKVTKGKTNRPLCSFCKKSGHDLAQCWNFKDFVMKTNQRDQSQDSSHSNSCQNTNSQRYNTRSYYNNNNRGGHPYNNRGFQNNNRQQRNLNPHAPSFRSQNRNYANNYDYDNNNSGHRNNYNTRSQNYENYNEGGHLN